MSQLAKDIWFYILCTIIACGAVAGFIYALAMGRPEIAAMVAAFGPTLQYLLGLLRNGRNGKRNRKSK